MLKINLKAHNGQYVCAEGGGGREIVANRNNPSIWETFTVNDNNGGRFESGDTIYLSAYNGQYLCAEGGGGREVVANRSNPSVWEKFTIEKVGGSGEIKSGDKVSLRSYNGQFLCAEGGGGREVIATKSRVDVWETFTIGIEGESSTSALPIRIKEYTRIGTAKHMETVVTLTEGGQLNAQTTTWTTWKAKGFTGGVIVVALDAKENILHQSQIHSFGVDGEWIGRSRRTDLWQETMDPSKLNNVKYLKVLHFHHGKNRLINIVRTVGELYEEIKKVIV